MVRAAVVVIIAAGRPAVWRSWEPKLGAQLTGSDEDWGSNPFLNPEVKKVMIVNTDTDTVTFRSITKHPDYMPKKVLRPGDGWWLDNSMMDANVQQMTKFHTNLRDYLESN